MTQEEYIKRLVDRLEALYREKINQFEEEFNQDWYDVSNEVNDLFFKEINKIYDSFIKEYYRSYSTKFYIRHWESRPGTRKGTNLYYGNQNKIHRGKDPYWEIIYDGSEMADDYQHDSADEVIENVVIGNRGVPPFWQETWSNKKNPYKSRYFQYTGTLLDAYYKFQKDYKKIMEPVFMRRWKKKRKGKI